MKRDSAAGRLKYWQKALHDRLDVFASYMSYLECDTAPGVGDHLLKQPEKYTANGTTASAFR